MTSQLRQALLCLAMAVLTACSSSSDSTTVAADFSAMGVKGTVSGQNVTIDLSGLGNCTTTLENMVMEVQASGYSVSPDPRVARNYSAPVDYTITAPDGSQATYKVTVKGAACNNTAPISTPTTKTCPTHSYGTTGYELVFKACDTSTGNNTFYDKTECVRDNTTGLIWQGQTAASTGLRANDQYKSNFDSTAELQKYSGTVSIYIAPNQTDVDASTNSIGYKNAVNDTNLCGYSNWRLPTKDELLGIVDSSATAAPYINTTWFPNTPQYGWYWTSSPYAGHASLAWGVDFFKGNADYGYRGDRDGYYDGVLVRLVR
ncbi:MAG TPA: DUF1566 domain-containing protein [Burkholderiaceae bacterium]|nr:DUF1566 domain-containing protein [Burkholderiaceae bacterium]